jgi:hypothetical protein
MPRYRPPIIQGTMSLSSFMIWTMAVEVSALATAVLVALHSTAYMARRQD